MADEENKANSGNTEPSQNEEPKQPESNPVAGENSVAQDEDFLKILDKAEQAASEDSFIPAHELSNAHFVQLSHNKIFSPQTALIALVILVMVIFAVPLYKMAMFQPIVITQTAQPSEFGELPRQQDASRDTQTARAQISDKTSQPLSLGLANNYFVTNDYHNAMAAYTRLYQALPKDNKEPLVDEFLRFRIAVCLWETGQVRQAENMFRSLTASSSMTIRMLANYYQARVELRRNQYLEARTYAYRAMAIAPAITADSHLSTTIQKDCSFIIGQAMTRHALALGDSDADIPDMLWRLPIPPDPFSTLNKNQLAELLDSGTTQFNSALLGPRIVKLVSDTTNRYSVVSFAAPLEELIARFAAHTNIEIKYNLQPHSRDLIKRPLNLYQPDVTEPELVITAVGCMGLIAQIENTPEKTVFIIENPADYTKLSEHSRLLTNASISLWQQYLIKFNEDRSVANANFAMALLLAQSGQIQEAIEQFKFVANRFSWSRLSPYALFYSSRLKADLQDYIGSRADLEQLVIQHDDMGLTPKAYLYLAQVSANAGLYRQATEIYNKMYNLDFSIDSKAAAALGAAQCMYQVKDYSAAQTWLVRYINLAKDSKFENLDTAYLLLGKTQLAMGDSENACNAFTLAISGRISDEDRIEIVKVLLDNQKEKSDLIRALDVLEAINPNQLSHEQSTNLLLLKSRIMRKMGLADKARELLRNKINYIFKATLQARTYVELAHCCVETGQLQAAHDHLTTALTLAEPGFEANIARFELANVSLMLGKSEQTISLCSQLLGLSIPDDMRAETLNLLAKAYKEQQQYEKALKTLIVQSKDAETLEKKLAVMKSE
ncbi:MAG: tetratricopeptide repeat protein [Phycisphaerae bacterium]